MLALAPPKPEDLARLTAGAGEPFREHLRRTFAMEEAWGMAAIVMIATGRAGGSPDIAATTAMDKFGEAMLDSAVYRVFFLEDDLAAYRRHMRIMRENAAQPAPAMLDGFDKHEKVIRATRGGGILAGLLLPAAYRVAVRRPGRRRHPRPGPARRRRRGLQGEARQVPREARPSWCRSSSRRCRPTRTTAGRSG